MSSSPFEPKRFEYEGQHLYFLPANFSELEWSHQSEIREIPLIIVKALSVAAARKND